MAKYEDELVLKDSVSDKLDKIAGKMDSLNSKANKVSLSFKKFGENATKVGRWAQTRIALPLAAAGTAMVKLAMDMEKTTSVFTTLLGSEQKATEMVSNIQKLAAETPLTTRGLTKNAQLLLNFGYSAEKIIPALRMLGDIAGGDQDRFNSLSLAFAQVQATGRLMGQDLLQMVNAGFNPLKIMSEQTGKSMATLKDEMGKGLITFEMVEQAMMSATSEGGKFFGLMNKQSQTAAGRLSTLQDNVELLATKLGAKLLPHVATIIEKLINLVDKFDRLDSSTQKFILTVGGLAIVLPTVTTAVGGLAAAFTFLQGHPVIFTIVKITAGLTALYEVAQKISEISFTKLFDWFGDDEVKTPQIIPMNKGESINDYLKRTKGNSSAIDAITQNISAANQTPIPQSTTNMTNTFNINGTVREEADITKIGNAIADRLQMTYINQGSY